jgi:DNA-directed RNA polymerase subunit F
MILTIDKDNKKFITVSEVKNILKKIEKERTEITYEQRIALEHANKFSKLTNQKTKELIKNLMKLEFIEESHIYKIADLLPKNNEDIKTIFAKERMNLDDNKINQILEVIKKYNFE